MNQPTPAIVTREAARRLPRWALLMFCAAYLLPGFIGREAWKSADMGALGFMAELAEGSARWLAPTLVGSPSENPALLPYWLGAVALQWSPSWLAPDFAVRLPFMGLLALCLACTWYATYHLASSPRAQPVAFAFGGEAPPKDYARAIADGGLLALIACLGLAQLAHETTPALAQTSFCALAFSGLSVLRRKRSTGLWASAVGLLGLALCGAPAMALAFGLGGLWIHVADAASAREPGAPAPSTETGGTVAMLLCALALTATVAWWADLWRWKLEFPPATWSHWKGFAELLIWFTWPAWPLAVWTLWRWRRQWLGGAFGRHIALPLWFVCVTLVATLASAASDRTLMLGLPALATLAAFALPTLQRQVGALIDWFTLLFFSGCGLTIWVVWIAMQTGFPAQPAANVARLAPGFVPTFSVLTCALALVATAVWAWLVRWRVGRHRTALWKSLVLPAGGAAWCWLLLMTLWLPLLNYTQSYSALVRHTLLQMQPQGCAHVLGLGHGTLAAYQFYGRLSLQPLDAAPQCPWLLAEPREGMQVPYGVSASDWVLQTAVRHPTDGNQTVLVFRRR
ncbi:hypothetical protein [Rhodoferax sp.]|uniref:hypothetical protein n=1 Tax=Rhodoferax sp. TaxID=50421 RepID=UPI003784E0BD